MGRRRWCVRRLSLIERRGPGRCQRCWFVAGVNAMLTLSIVAFSVCRLWMSAQRGITALPARSLEVECRRDMVGMLVLLSLDGGNDAVHLEAFTVYCGSRT